MNTEQRIAGHTETPLTSEGRRQAKKAGQAAKGIQFDLIVCSPLQRAAETAKIFATECGYPPGNIKSSPLLIERFFGVAEGEPYGSAANYDDVEKAEREEALLQRAHLALEWINSFDADTILVVSHGAFGRALRSVLKTDYPMSHPDRINNAELLRWTEEDN